MNEQELLMKQKIEKREKTDTILAYILIVVLLACILIVLYLKFIKKEDNTPESEEYTVSYMTLNDVSNALLNSELAKKYAESGIIFNVSQEDNSLKISYSKEDKVFDMNVPFINSELEVTVEDENKDIITDIYKEITTEVCNFYNNDMNNCRSKVNSITSDTDGIRFLDNKIYINIMKSIELDNNDEKILKLGETLDTLNKGNINFKNIKSSNTDEKITVSGTLTSTTENDVFNVIVKLYNEAGEVLSENKKEYTAENPLNSEETFEISFDINDELPLDVVRKYSITIER